ncbi:GH25 family lysozyme [Prauserella cavernicola]|uniref:Lysozyme n=1 Tax=Prauserella cavernicola TaxID=2800127 RepID=A0A934V4L3_9PSEU|nr:GH25 family lysozyme [Prauserella cavernicola]MBK1785532.1 lysozyme [Prauserella cavernicola]
MDLSLHETVDDWAAMRARSVRFASITVTESLNWTDDTAVRQLGDALRAGVHAGIRHYARAGAVQDQARHFVRTGMPLGAFAPGALAPTLDVGADGIDDRFIKAWIKAVRSASGVRRVLVYATYEDWLHRFRPDKWADSEVVLWLVRHNGIPGRPGWFHSRLGLHQHSAGRPHGADALVYPFTLADVLL